LNEAGTRNAGHLHLETCGLPAARGGNLVCVQRCNTTAGRGSA